MSVVLNSAPQMMRGDLTCHGWSQYTLQVQSWNKTSWVAREVPHLWVPHWHHFGVCHPLVSSLGLLPAIACELSPFGWQHQEQGLPRCISMGTSLRNGIWGKFSPFLTLRCFGSVTLFIHTYLPLCQGQCTVESRMIQASVAQYIALRF